MTEDDVRRIIREEIDRARYLSPVLPYAPPSWPAYPAPRHPGYPNYWPATCSNAVHVSEGTV